MNQYLLKLIFVCLFLPDTPINVPVLDTSRVTVQGDGLRQVAVNRQSFFRVQTGSAGEAELTARVTCRSSQVPMTYFFQLIDLFKSQVRRLFAVITWTELKPIQDGTDCYVADMICMHKVLGHELLTSSLFQGWILSMRLVIIAILTFFFSLYLDK